MTLGPIHELADELCSRYLRSDRKGRSPILDEFCGIANYHRKAAIRLMNRRPRSEQSAGGRGLSAGARIGGPLPVPDVGALAHQGPPLTG